jgi:hypothetical protein
MGIHVFAGQPSAKRMNTVNWDRVEREWKERRGEALHHRGKVLNGEAAAIAARSGECVAKFHETGVAQRIPS